MPFTPAHVAAVLPLMRGRPARYLVPAALAVGAMTPDLPLFLPRWAPVSEAYARTHAPSGLLTWDLVLGLLAYLAWLVVRGPLLDLAPVAVRRRVPAPPLPSRWPWVAVSVVLGAATHIVWDDFTHGGRRGVELVPWLAESTAGLPHYKLLQYLSGVLGVAVVLVVVARLFLRSRTQAPDLGVLSPRERRHATVGLLGLVVALVLFFAAQLVGQSSLTAELVAYLMVTRTIGTILAVVAFWAVVWHTVTRTRIRVRDGRPADDDLGG